MRRHASWGGILALLMAGVASARTNTFPTSGNVGVGTTAPPNSLTLGSSPNGAWNPAYTTLDYGYIYGSSYETGLPSTDFGQTGWGNNQYCANGASYAVGTGASSFIVQGSGQISFAVAPSVSGGSPLSFTEAMHIANSGAVGIGTTSPAENGPIKPEDLSVTASIPGYAMTGTDRSRMLGAVIGKALGSLDNGTVVIGVGVTPQ
jgi:hypothetical protein